MLVGAGTLRWLYAISDVRHERCGESLEEERNGSVETGKICAETEAKGQSAGEEGDDSEEQGDQVEGEHEPAQVPELVGANELRGNVVLSAEVARRVEGQRSAGTATECVLAVFFAAERKERPARRVAELVAAGNAVCRGLEEVGVSDRAGVDDAGEDHEELEDNAAGKDDHCDHPEDRTCRRVLGMRIACVGIGGGFVRVMAMATVVLCY
jgi:hypothetical protein